jgi:alpha-galactosidase
MTRNGGYDPKVFMAIFSAIIAMAMFITFIVPAPNVPAIRQTQLTPTPPMGWNSFDAYGTTVTEAEVRANAEYMAKNLKQYGWEYIVVDIQWYEPNAKAGGYRKGAALDMDELGRLIPAVNRFPSSAGGKGFKPLADYVHSLGLKFGIHIMRGVPRQAQKKKTRILGSDRRASDIANKKNVSSWNDDMFGIDMKKRGAQEYYDSIAQLYADWGVDYIKADDMTNPYQEAEITALSAAIKKTGRPMVLSLSPGEAPADKGDHLRANADLWRISLDLWDRWDDLKKMFALTKRWESQIGKGGWPDADMLPLGRIGIRAELGTDRASRLTRDEQRTLMTLWSIFRSPLMFGGDLPSNDEWTLSLLTNEEVLAVNQASSNNREMMNDGSRIVWTANAPDGSKYVALFNIGDDGPLTVSVKCADLGISAKDCKARDLWERKEFGVENGIVSAVIAPHASMFFKVFEVE